MSASDPKRTLARCVNLAVSIESSCAPRCECPVSRREHNDNRADLDTIEEVDHVLVGHADAARRDCSADIFGLVGAIDAVLRVLAAGVQIEPARTHRILRATGHKGW